jgi:hypothetical protein
MSNAPKNRDGQIFDGLLVDATPEVRALFESFLQQCLRAAEDLQEHFGKTDRNAPAQKKMHSVRESINIPPVEGDKN